ncbi:hypothetical protein DDZ13_10210 [Coraliomargarita sinensis]|uniref:Permuted papain-like amidase enzyme, YaeF/YiiX, C92 family n=1 Tax=Coraliomargarita sinensis TaxID=2174842 RepID=A0A317ZJX7_9BACT|nr:YiiX/YebB-like N1pC/P60 family cysteine hydrolase [Coraliomargarita sinensis]PXA03661.1 hypothetical protein DDZ13_10210 [Coraliomargarita sinensis]
MHYQAIRPKLRSGDLLLCSGRSTFSRLIQVSTGSEWSHIGLVLRLERLDRVMLLESVESMGVRAIPLSRYYENYEQTGAAYPGKLAIYRHQDFPGEADAGTALTKLGRFAVDRLGWPYDGKQIAELAARLALHYVEGGARGGEPRAGGMEHGDNVLPDGSLENQAYICSEYVAACYRTLGLEIACNACPYVTPGDFVADRKVGLV